MEIVLEWHEAAETEDKRGKRGRIQTRLKWPTTSRLWIFTLHAHALFVTRSLCTSIPWTEILLGFRSDWLWSAFGSVNVAQSVPNAVVPLKYLNQGRTTCALQPHIMIMAIPTFQMFHTSRHGDGRFKLFLCPEGKYMAAIVERGALFEGSFSFYRRIGRTN